jgi:hypothetical protein
VKDQFLLKMHSVYGLLFIFSAVSASNGFNPLQHSGPASPYFDAPSQDDIPVETPAGCIVDQAAYILRHGSQVAISESSFVALMFFPKTVPGTWIICWLAKPLFQVSEHLVHRQRAFGFHSLMDSARW